MYLKYYEALKFHKESFSPGFGICKFDKSSFPRVNPVGKNVAGFDRVFAPRKKIHRVFIFDKNSPGQNPVAILSQIFHRVSTGLIFTGSVRGDVEKMGMHDIFNSTKDYKISSKFAGM